jgi:hypothetical protein
MPSGTIDVSNDATVFLAKLAGRSNAIRHSPALGMNLPRQ